MEINKIAKKSMKSQMMTAAVLLMFSLMLVELFAFLIINTNYNSLSQASAISTGSSNLLSSLQQGSTGFARQSLQQAITTLAAFEYNPSLRKGDFISNLSNYASSMIMSGIIPNTTYGVAQGSVASSSAISTGTAGFPTGSAARSIFAWVYPNTNGAVFVLFSYGAAVSLETTEFWINPGSGGSMNFYEVGGGEQATPSSLVPNLNAWNFVGVTYPGSGTTFTFYLNGQTQTATLPNAPNTVITSSDPSDIGKESNNPGSAYAWRGSIANLQLYNTALSTAQVAQLYNQGMGSLPIGNAGIVGWWPLEGNSNDYSGNGNAGTAYNVIWTSSPGVSMGSQTLAAYNLNFLKSFNLPGTYSINETQPYIYQASPYTISVKYNENVRINSSTGSYVYGIPVNATLNLTGEPDLFYAQQGVLRYLTFGNLSKSVSRLGNINATIGSLYNFVYGTAYFVAAGGGCPSGFGTAANSIILVTQSASGVSSCANGFGGLISTSNTISGTPTVPYLGYPPSVILQQVIKSGSSLLLYGPEFSAFNIEQLRNAVSNGYYFASAGSASYMQRAVGQQSQASPQGIFTFGTYNKQAAQFNGQSGNISMGNPTSLDITGGSLTLAGWAYLNPCSSTDTYPGIISRTTAPYPYGGYMLSFDCFTDKFQFSVASAAGVWQVLETSSTVSPGNWYFVIGTYNSSKGVSTIYLNGAASNTLSISGNIRDNGASVVIGSNEQAVFNGSISNVQVYSTSISNAQAASLYREGIEGLPLRNQSLVGWWPLNGNANDYSGIGNSGSSANVVYTLAPSGVPTFSAAQFNGATSNITIADSSALRLTSAGSVSTWIYLTSAPSGYIAVLNKGASASSNANSYSIDIFRAPYGSLFGLVCGSSSCSEPAALSPALPLDTWTLCTLTWNGADTYLYVDGALYQSASMSQNPSTSGSPLVIGDNPAYGYFPGSIADTQVYNTQLSSTQVAQLYSAGIGGAPITGAGLVGWWPLNGNANDYSGNGNFGNATAVTFTQIPSGITDSITGSSYYNLYPLPGVLSCYNVQGCFNASNNNAYLSSYPIASKNYLQVGSFNGASSLIEVPDSASLDLTNAGTVSFWMNLASLPSGYTGLINKVPYGGAAGNGYYYVAIGRAPFDNLYANVGGSSSSAEIFGPTGNVLPTNKWVFGTLTWNGADDYLYINGTLNGYASMSQNPNTAGYPLFIGWQNDGYSNFNGLLANVQIYNAYLTAAQVSQLYGEGIAGAPLVPGNIVGWWPLNGNANDYSGSKNNAQTDQNVAYPYLPANFSINNNFQNTASTWQVLGFGVPTK